MNAPIPAEIVVPGGADGARLDIFLRDHLSGFSRAWVKGQLERGRVFRNGRAAKKGDVLAAGDRIDLSRFRPPGGVHPAPPGAPEAVVLAEDEAFVAVVKDAGLPTLPRDDEDTDALACRLAARFPELATVGGPLEAGLAHRLDTGTSGVMIAARTAEAYDHLRDQWRLRRVEKRYVALVAGDVSAGFAVALPIGHHRSSAKRMVAGEGLPAETRIEPIARGARETVVLALLREGRRHQIRVHLAEAGHPVAGDPLYGRAAGAERTDAPRLMLHAYSLRFRPSPDRQPVLVVSDPPEDFIAVVRDRLGEEGAGAMLRGLRSVPPAW